MQGTKPPSCQVIPSANSTTTTTKSTTATTATSHVSIPTGELIGFIGGGVAALGLLAGGLFVYWRRWRRRKLTIKDEETGPVHAYTLDGPV